MYEPIATKKINGVEVKFFVNRGPKECHDYRCVVCLIKTPPFPFTGKDVDQIVEGYVYAVVSANYALGSWSFNTLSEYEKLVASKLLLELDVPANQWVWAEFWEYKNDK